MKKLTAKTMAAVAGLAVALTMTACGGSGSTDTAAGDSSSARSANTDCRPASADDVAEAAWAKGAEPDHAIVLTDAYPLPSDMSPEMSRLTASVGARAVQAYSGDRIGITLHNLIGDELGGMPDGREGKQVKYSAMYNADGKLIGQKVDRYNINGSIKSTEEQGSVEGINDPLSRKHNWGTFRMAAADGITIPAEAASDKTDGDYALDILIDDENSDRLWLLLRGGTDLYKARVVEATPGTDPTSCV